MQVVQSEGDFGIFHMDKFRLHKTLTKREYIALLKKVCEQVPVGIGVMDTKGRWLMTNATMEDYLPKGAPSIIRENVIHWRAYDEYGHLVPRKNWPGQRALRGEVVQGMEMIFTQKDGSERWMRVSTVPFRDAHKIAGAISVVQDINEIKMAEEAKNDFISMLSHELRNPLATVLTSVELLTSEINHVRETPVRNRLRTIVTEPVALVEHQIKTMVRLINDLLDISRIVHRKISLNKEIVELHPIVERAIAACRPDINAARHSLAVSMPKKAYVLRGDPVRIEQIIVNLLKNAAKYTPKRGHIWLSVSRAGRNAVIRVKDDGIGISKEKIAEIFKPFSQAAKPASGSYEGLGLGLTLVQSLSQLHGGSIRVNSKGGGRGSEFVVQLPLALTKQH